MSAAAKPVRKDKYSSPYYLPLIEAREVAAMLNTQEQDEPEGERWSYRAAPLGRHGFGVVEVYDSDGEPLGPMAW